MALSKVFRIELKGGQDVTKGFESIKKSIGLMQGTIKSAKNELVQLLASNADPKLVTELQAKIIALRKEEQNLAQTRKQTERDIKAQAQAEKLLAEAKLKAAQAAKLQAQADRERVKSQIDQEKELDRQIALENKQTAALQKQKLIADALPGSYIRIKEALAQLRPFIQSGGAGGVTQFQGRTINFEQAKKEFERLSFAEQNFRRQFVQSGTLVGEYADGIVNAFKTLKIDDIIKNQVNGAKQQLGQLETKTQALVVAYRKAQQSGSADLNKLEKEIHDNVVETQKLKAAVAQAETQLRGIGGVGTQITSSISKGFNQFKNSIAQFALGFVGFQALFSGIQTGVGNAKQLSDQTTELEIQLNKAAGGADNLVTALAKLNTRTKLTVLEDMANVALRAGVTEQNILGVVKAIDVVKTAFGKDFGDIETGTETFVKLINIFFEDGQITEDRILKIGNAIRTIANESVASVPFINDFAARMAGVKQIANVTLPQIIGLGAGFEEFKQSAEVSSTVLVKVIPELARNLDEFAKIAGVSKQEFKTLLQDAPIEALLQVSEGLVKGKGDVEIFANALKDAGVDAGRTTSIIATLGGKADIFRKRIASAGDAINSTGAITDAFEKKNNNLAATLDKVGKRFADAANSKAFQASIVAISSVILLLINNIPALLGLLGVLTAAWAAQNVPLILARAQIILYNLAIGASTIAMFALRVALLAHTVVMGVWNLVMAAATRAAKLFGITLTASTGPLGIILTIVGLLGGALLGMSKALGSGVENLSKFATRLKFSNEIIREANLGLSEQRSKIDTLTSVIKDQSLSLETRNKALQELISLNPAYLKGLNLQNIFTSEGKKILDGYNESLQKTAELQAAQAIKSREFEKLVQLKTIKQDLEFLKGSKAEGIPVALLDKALKKLEKEIGQQSKNVESVTEVLKKKYSGVADAIKEGDKKIALGTTVVGRTIEAIQADLKDANDKFDKAIIDSADYKALKKKIDLLDKELASARGDKTKTFRGSKVTGEDKDELAKIDALRDKQLADEKKRFLEGLINERDYLVNVLRINTGAIDKKLKLIKNGNAAEKKLRAELQLERITNEQETNKKLFDIDNKALENRLRNQEIAIQTELEIKLSNPDLNFTDQLKAQEDFYNDLLQAQIVFNQQQIALEKLFAQSSVENAQKRKEAIEKIFIALREIQKQTPEAKQKDIQEASNRQIDDFSARVAAQTTAILNSNKSFTQKAKELAALEKQATIDRLASEKAAAEISFNQAQKDRAQKLISESEYLDKLRDFKEKEAALYQATTNAQVTATGRFILALKELKDQFLETFLGIKQYTKDSEGEQERITDAVNASISLVQSAIQTAYQAWFTNEDARIEREKETLLASLDREKQRVLAQAQSNEERDAIERRFEQKKRSAEKKASEEKKKNALKQIAIDFAVSIIKALAQYGLPLALIPIAAQTVMYFVQRSTIQKQQFAKGGKVQPEEREELFRSVPNVRRIKNGRIRTAPNIRRRKNGDNILATVKTGEVILNEKQQRLLGGAATFKRIGVPGFATGGITKTQFGETLRPPQFNNGFYSAGVNSNLQSGENLAELKQMVADVTAAVYASDTKEVQLVPSKVTKAQERKRKDVSLASI